MFFAWTVRRCKDVARSEICEARAPIRIRTEDPFITNEVLYQLSYWGYARRRLNDEADSCKVEKTLRRCDLWAAVNVLMKAAEVHRQLEDE